MSLLYLTLPLNVLEGMSHSQDRDGERKLGCTEKPSHHKHGLCMWDQEGSSQRVVLKQRRVFAEVAKERKGLRGLVNVLRRAFGMEIPGKFRVISPQLMHGIYWGILKGINTDAGLLKNVYIKLSVWEGKASQEGYSLNEGGG